MKRRVVFGVLLVMLVWPFVHHVLAERYGFNQWRLFGLAMYCKPSPIPVIEVSDLTATQKLDLRAASQQIPGLEQVARDFTRRRKLWGQLSHPDDLATAILEGLPGTPGVRIYVNTLVLDAGIDTYRVRSSLYECRVLQDPPCDAVYEE